MTEAVVRPVGQAPGVSPGEQSVVSPTATLRALVLYFLGLGTWGFGGPVVLVERMRRDLQEARGWFTVAELKEAIALAQLAPGPLAAQVAIYLGWLRAGLVGATLVGVAFIAPSFVMVLAPQRGVRAVRRTLVDAGGVLRRGRGRHRDHRRQCVEARTQDSREGHAAVGHRPHERRGHCGDGTRDRFP